MSLPNIKTPANDIALFSNDENFFIWKTDNRDFQRISWIDETAVPVTFQMHEPAGDVVTAETMPVKSAFDMTRVANGTPGDIEVAGVWTGSGAAFGISCIDQTLSPLPFYLTVNNDQVLHHCGTPAIDADTLHSLFSTTKSVTSLAFGAAWQNGLIDASALA